MMTIIISLVDACRRHAWLVLAGFIFLTSAAGWYAANHFRMNTDVNTLLATDLPWRQQEQAMEQAFPARNDLLVVVIDGKTPAITEKTAANLAAKMSGRPDLFRTIKRPDALPFFTQNGLLFLEQAKLADVVDHLMQAQPLLGSLAADQSLRGLFRTFTLMLRGVKENAIQPEQFAPIFTKVTTIIKEQQAGKISALDWATMLGQGEANPRQLRRFILAQPVLNYAALSPGADATAAVRAMIQSMGIDALSSTAPKLTEHCNWQRECYELRPTPEITVRLTGSVALNDEEFASVADGMGMAAIGSSLLVMLLLFLALRSVRLVLPILVTLTSGLIITTACGLAVLGSLNLISVAFTVMFIGIAVDFGIQFGVRFREEFHSQPDRIVALQATARVVAQPLFLAATCTAAGFLAFTPTAYTGVAELGFIAGIGMMIALLCNITLLPALLTILKPPAEAEAVGFSWLRPLDGFLQRQRRGVMVVAALLGVVSIGLTSQLKFDFDPLNLKDPQAESVATLFDLAKNLDSTPYTAQILAANLTEADDLAAKLAALPEIARVMTLSSFIPENQDSALPILQDAKQILLTTLTPSNFALPPRAVELQQGATALLAALQELRTKHTSIAALADALEPMTTDAEALFALQDNLISGLPAQLQQIRDLLSAERVTIEAMPAALKEDWLAADGRARIEIYPKENPRDPAALVRFNNAIRTIAPHVTGTTIAMVESGNTVVNAFVQSAISAILVIGLLVLLTLRRIFDTLALLAPLLLASLLTLATTVLLHIPINFANIIGLPLLLGVGVSFAIYFISYWRDGGTTPLQSGMARAVLFSASTTLVAFGSLALSTHPGTASMGKILTLSLLYALACSYLLLPALLRPAKQSIG